MSRWKRRRQRQQRTTNPTPSSGDFFVSEVRTFCMSVDRVGWSSPDGFRAH